MKQATTLSSNLRAFLKLEKLRASQSDRIDHGFYHVHPETLAFIKCYP